MSLSKTNVSERPSKLNQADSLEDIFKQLEIEGTQITPTFRKDFDKIHAAIEARAKYLEKRKKSRKRYHGPSRKTLSDHKHFNPQAWDFGVSGLIRRGYNLVSGVNKFYTTAERVAGKVESAMDISAAALTTMFETIQSKKFKYMALTNGTLTLAKWGIQKPTFLVLLIDIIQLFVTTFSEFVFMTSQSILKAAQEFIDSFAPSTPEQQVQGGAGFNAEAIDIQNLSDSIPIIASVVSLLATALVGRQIIASPDILKSVKSYGDLGRATNGIKNLINNSLGLTTWVMESISAVVSDYRGKSMVSTDKDCIELQINDTFMKEVEELIDPIKFVNHMMSPEYLPRLSAARYRLLQFTGQRSANKDLTLRTFILQKIATLDKIIKENISQFVGKAGNMRMVPFCIQLVGNPGEGKSTVMNPLARAIMTEAACGRVFENNAISSMSGVSKYWDAFRGETVLLIDDGFMTRGSTPGESEYTRFMNLISCISMTVPKADLSSKGMTADSVRLVIISSNCEKPTATEINNSDACLRRRHLVLIVARKNPNDPITDPIDDHCRFMRRNPFTQQNMGEWMTYSEMLWLAGDCFKAHLDEQEKLILHKDVPTNFFTNRVKREDFAGPKLFSEALKNSIDSAKAPVVLEANFKPEDIAKPQEFPPFYVNKERAFDPALDQSIMDLLATEKRSAAILKELESQVKSASTVRLQEERVFDEVDDPRSTESKVELFPTYEAAGFTAEGVDDWNFRAEAPEYTVETYQPEIVVDYHGSRLLLPYYKIEPFVSQTREHKYYNHSSICCSPVRIYDEKHYPWAYCNATRDFSNSLDLTVADFEFDRLTEDHYETFCEALDAGIMLPQRSLFDRCYNPCENEEAQAWEAFRLQERAFRTAMINQSNVCLAEEYEFMNNIQQEPDHDYDLNGPISSFVHSRKLYSQMHAFEAEGWFGKVDSSNPSSPWMGYLLLITEAIAITLSIFAGIKFFRAINNYCRKSKVMIPNLDYDAQSLQQFIDSAPEQYQGQLLAAVSNVADTVQKETRMAYESLAYDGTGRPIPNIRWSPEGIVYDGSAKNVKAMAMKVQSAFEQNGIKTLSSKSIVSNLLPEGIDENFSVQRSAVIRNSVTFHKMNFPDIVAIRGIGMRDRDVLIPHHFINTFGEDEQVRIQIGAVSTYFRYQASMIRTPGNMTETKSDYAILRLPTLFNQFRDITHVLLREKDINKLASSAPIHFQRGFQSDAGYANLDFEVNYINDIDENKTPFKRYIARGMTYNVMTAKGDCGAAVLLGCNSTAGILSGIHVAGQDGKGLAQLITREMYMALSDLKEESGFEKESMEHMAPFILSEDKIDVEAHKKIQNDPELPAWGLVPNAYASVPAGSSKFEFSEITKTVMNSGEEFFPSKRAQPTFSLNDKRVDEVVREAGIKPMSLSLNKYAKAPHTFPSRPFTLAYTTILTVLSTIVPIGISKRLLNFDETLNGITNFIAPIDVRTSVGFPYVKLTRGAPGKSALIKNLSEPGQQANYVLNDDPNGPKFQGKLLSDYFWDRYKTVETKIRQGIVPAYFAYENMKDELVSEKKIKNGKVRTFECLPLEISLLTRRYFGVFMGAMQQQCVEKPVSVGINPTSMDWTHLFNRLTRFGETALIAGDYSNWDGKLMADVLLKCIEAINEWYNDSEENKKARIALALSFIHTDILVLNTLVRKRSGMPSGVPVTAPLNSVANWFYILAAVVDMLEQQDFEKRTGQTLTPQFLIEHIESAFYGDDHVVALSGLLQKYINFQKFMNYFAAIGINYTDSQKRENVDFEFENIYQITYLKRRFLRDKNRPKLIRAPLDLNSITDMIVWTKKSPSATNIEVYKSRVKDFEDSLAQHEQETYDAYIKIFNHAIDIVHQNKPHMASNYHKIYTSYTDHTQNFLRERGAI